MNFVWRDEQVIARIRQAAMQGVIEGTELVHSTAVRLIMNGPKTGKVYRRRGVEHQASAPGEPPASDTGALVQRSGTEYDQANLVGTVTFHSKYAAALEFGTERIEPRPFARPALAMNREAIQDAIGRRIAAVTGPAS
jgi:HK97 gp10 family phage protein